MKHIIIAVLSIILFFGAADMLSARNHYNQSEEMLFVQPDTAARRALLKEVEEFTNNCDIVDSLIIYAANYFNQAVELQGKANAERDDSKYEEYMR